MKLRITFFLFSTLFVATATHTLRAQVIEPTIGESLTITEDISLAAGKSIRLADTVVLKSSNVSTGNLFLGLRAGSANQSAINNTFLGTNAGQNSNGQANTFVGYSAGRFTTSGQFNTFFGVQAGLNNTTGSANFIMGTNAGVNNTTGTANFFLGDNTGGNNTTGGFNVYLGTNAGNGTGVNGDNNVSIGFESGRGNNGGNTNTFVGFRADASATGLNNAMALGANARVAISNAIVLGSGASVGIGNNAPTARLHVTSGIANTSGLRLENLTSGATATLNASKFLTVDGSGNVVLANIAGGGRQGAETTADNLWQRNGQFLRSAKGEAIVIGQGVDRMPTGYSLFVGQGVLTEKVKVAIKNTSDWSDYVFLPSYKLTPLDQVEQYINQHQHLPGIPSAQEMVEQGNDLHQTDAKLLAKIEELTLYSIQLEKTAKEQRATIQQQQADINTLKEQMKLLLEKK